MRPLSTPLCTLEPQVVAHAAELFEALRDRAIYEFEGEPPPSVERLAAGLARKEARVSPDGTETWLNWVVRCTSGEVAGYVQATVLRSGCAYIGYELSSRHWRQGLGSSAVGAVLEELARRYAVHTAVAVLKSANFRSMGLLRKLGFTACPAERVSEFEVDADESILLKPVRSTAEPGMTNALFVYGSLKQGFANEHVNTGRRIEGRYRTRAPYALFLLGDGEVPCLVAPAGRGQPVAGELYAVGDDDLARMDRLERLGEPGGYERVMIEIERVDVTPPARLEAMVYLKQEHALPPDVRRIGPLAEYLPEHAARFRWRGAD